MTKHFEHNLTGRIYVPAHLPLLREIRRWGRIRKSALDDILGRDTGPSLSTLFHHTDNLVERVLKSTYRTTADKNFFSKGGSEPYIYTLSHRGRRLVREADEDEKYTTVHHAGNLEHQLLNSDIAGAVYRSARDIGATITDQSDLPGAPQSFSFSHDGDRIEVEPDWLFRLNFPSGARLHFCVEADRGKMPEDRKTSNTPQRSIYQKAWKYAALRVWLEEEKPYGIPGIAVLLVTTSKRRRIEKIQSMLIERFASKPKTVRHPGYGPNMMLINDYSALKDNLFLKPWYTAEGTVVINNGGK